MPSFTNRIKPDSTELEKYFLSVYTGHLWNALEKIKDWHSPEHIEKEVQMKLLKLQQQALPVVPEDVAKWIECVKGKNNNALALLDDDNMPDDVNEWLFFQRNDDNINLILRAWLDGYTVEKSDKCMVKLGALYFKCWNDVDAVFIIDDQPGAYESAFVFKKREDAEKVAQLVGGRVVKN